MNIPVDLTKGLYDPTFEPDLKALSDFVENPDKRREKVQKKVRSKIEPATTPEGFDGNPKAPLTEEEAAEVDLYIENLRGRINTQREEIRSIKDIIDGVASPDGGEEFNVKLPIENRPSLQKAVQLVFGVSTDNITYSMYKAAVELKRQIEDSETNSYVGVE